MAYCEGPVSQVPQAYKHIRLFNLACSQFNFLFHPFFTCALLVPYCVNILYTAYSTPILSLYPVSTSSDSRDQPTTLLLKGRCKTGVPIQPNSSGRVNRGFAYIFFVPWE